MTAIFYPDCRAGSPDGRFILDARSPHNGTIPHRDGRPAADEYPFRYRKEQREFRYRLMSIPGGAAAATVFGRGGVGGRVVWERWQATGEDSPHELVVADNDGWSVIRTHGYSPEVIAVDPAGRDAVRVRVLGPIRRADDDGSAEAGAAGDTATLPTRCSWRARHLPWSSGGAIWTEHSWRYFFRVHGRPYFAWRTYWGQRLVIDLAAAALALEEALRDGEVAHAMDGKERDDVVGLLSALSGRWDDVRRLLARRDADADEANDDDRRLADDLRRATAALHLAGVHRIAACVPFLRRWEAVEYLRHSTSSAALGLQGSVGVQYFRPIAQHALRLLGEEPQAYPSYHFTPRDGGRLPTHEGRAGRRERLAGLDQSLSAADVLLRVGPPDHVRKRSHPVGTLFRWTEEWEYDIPGDGEKGGGVTVRITGAEGRRTARITAVEELAACWLGSDEWALEILRF